MNDGPSLGVSYVLSIMMSYKAVPPRLHEAMRQAIPPLLTGELTPEGYFSRAVPRGEEPFVGILSIGSTVKCGYHLACYSPDGKVVIAGPFSRDTSANFFPDNDGLWHGDTATVTISGYGTCHYPVESVYNHWAQWRKRTEPLVDAEDYPWVRAILIDDAPLDRGAYSPSHKPKNGRGGRHV